MEEQHETQIYVLENRGRKISRIKREYICVNARASGTVRLQGAEAKKLLDFRNLG